MKAQAIMVAEPLQAEMTETTGVKAPEAAGEQAEKGGSGGETEEEEDEFRRRGEEWGG